MPEPKNRNSGGFQMAIEITQELIDKCCRFEVELPGGKTEVRYAVESRTQDDVEYIVRFIKGLVCTCPASNPPVDYYGTPLYAPRPCWHMRAAVAHAEMYRKEQATIARNEHILKLEAMGLTREEAVTAVDAKLLVDGKPADDATLVRVFGSRQPRPSEAEMNGLATKANKARPFALV
jgi:hypothetical protein